MIGDRDPKHCSASVHDHGRPNWQSHQCPKLGVLSHEGKLYCKRHYPPNVAAKDKARQDKWDAEVKAKNAQRERAEVLNQARDAVIAAADAWLDSGASTLTDENAKAVCQRLARAVMRRRELEAKLMRNPKLDKDGDEICPECEAPVLCCICGDLDEGKDPYVCPFCGEHADDCNCHD